jgi:hypothetical protein
VVPAGARVLGGMGLEDDERRRHCGKGSRERRRRGSAG